MNSPERKRAQKKRGAPASPGVPLASKTLLEQDPLPSRARGLSSPDDNEHPGSVQEQAAALSILRTGGEVKREPRHPPVLSQ